MNCDEILAALNDYVDGLHDTPVCQALEKHLADCNPCRLVVDNIRQTITLYKYGRPMELPDELQTKLDGLLRRCWAEKFAERQR